MQLRTWKLCRPGRGCNGIWQLRDRGDYQNLNWQPVILPTFPTEGAYFFIICKHLRTILRHTNVVERANRHNPTACVLIMLPVQPRWPVEMWRWQRDVGNKDSPCPLQQFLNSDEVLISSTARRIISPLKGSIPAKPFLSGRLQPDVKLKNSPLTVTLIKNTRINNFACKTALQGEMPGGFAVCRALLAYSYCLFLCLALEHELYHLRWFSTLLVFSPQ